MTSPKEMVVKVRTVAEDDEEAAAGPANERPATLTPPRTNAPNDDALVEEAMQSLRKQLSRIKVRYDESQRDFLHSQTKTGACTPPREARNLFGGNHGTPPRPHHHNDASFLASSDDRSLQMKSPQVKLSTAATSHRHDPAMPLKSLPFSAIKSTQSCGLSTKQTPLGTTRTATEEVQQQDSYQHENDAKDDNMSTLMSPSAVNNQSFASAGPPAPVQTPHPLETGISSSPLDTDHTNAKDHSHWKDDHEIRIRRLERAQAELYEEIRHWRAEAAFWQRQAHEREMTLLQRQQSRAEMEGINTMRQEPSQIYGDTRESRLYDYKDSEDDIDRAYHDSLRDASRRYMDVRAPASLFRDRRGYKDSYIPSSSVTFCPRTSRGSRFVEELSDNLALDADQRAVLASLMDRYLEEDS